MPLPDRRAIVYIDGFNLYYNAIIRTQFKWLNFAKFVKAVRTNDTIVQIKYFTALVEGRGQVNQLTFWKALETLPSVQIIKGKHKKKQRQCLVRECRHSGDRTFTSLEEKRTDVSIAIEMLDDAYQDRCDIFVLISGDSDLVPVIKKIRDRFPSKEVTVYVPNRGGDDGHHEIRGAAHRARDLPLNVLKHAQFPDKVPDGYGGSIEKPRDW